jgi:hypothetical protein
MKSVEYAILFIGSMVYYGPGGVSLDPPESLEYDVRFLPETRNRIQK